MAFRRSDAPYRGFVGGIGSGKSWVGALDLVRRAAPGRLYMVTAPTYPMLRDASLRSFLAHTDALGYLREFRRGVMTAVLGNRAEVLFRTADDPDRLRGPNLSGVWMDEASICGQASYEVLIGRLREGGEQGGLSATFTPKGKTHWTYEVFGKGRPDTALFHARTDQNPFLPAGFADRLRLQYPSELAAQELGGEFVTGGGVFFDRSKAPVLPAVPVGTAAVRYWDTAATKGVSSANTAGVLMGRDPGGRFVVCDCVAGSWTPAERNEVIRQTCAADRRRPGVRVLRTYVERPSGFGAESVEALIRFLAGYSVEADPVNPADGSKQDRAIPLRAQWEVGNVGVLDADWAEAFLSELEGFPHGKRKDRVDAAAGAFNKLAGGSLSEAPTTGRPGDRQAPLPAGTFD
jgi:predicted phage terminase large subunit-like protein